MNHKWKIAAVSFLCAVALLSVGFSAVTLIRLHQIEQNVTMVQHSVTSIDSDINSTLNSAINTITQSAEKSASILSDYRVKWGDCNHDDQTMQVTIQILPKEYSDQTQVRLRYSGSSVKGAGYDLVFDSEGFAERTAEAPRVEDGVYEAQLTIPLADYISLNVEIQEGDVIRQEKIEDQYAAWNLNLLHPQMAGGFDSYTVRSSNKNSIDYTAFASVDLLTSYDVGGVSDTPQMTGGTITLYLNGEEVTTRQLGQSEVEGNTTETVTQADGEIHHVWSSSNDSYPTYWSGKLENLKDRDLVTFVVRIQDENGFTYEQEVGRCLFEVKNGMISGSEESILNPNILVR
jgi:hypothetical protein